MMISDVCASRSENSRLTSLVLSQDYTKARIAGVDLVKRIVECQKCSDICRSRVPEIKGMVADCQL